MTTRSARIISWFDARNPLRGLQLVEAELCAEPSKRLGRDPDQLDAAGEVESAAR